METQRKNSRKRQAVYDALSSVYDHPTAEMLYNRLKPDYPELSLGTVYRNLSILEEEGLAIKVCNVDGQERYDAKTGSHAHFVCRACRRVFDFRLPEELEKLYEGVSSSQGFQVENCSLSFTGLCEQCREC